MVAPRAASRAADPYNFGQCGRDGVRKDLQVLISVSVSLLLVIKKYSEMAYVMSSSSSKSESESNKSKPNLIY